MAGLDFLNLFSSPTVTAPAQVPLATQTRDTLQAQIDLAPFQLTAYQNTAPGYANTDVGTQYSTLFGPFDANKYLAARPDLVANYNSNPGLFGTYGSMQDYAKADFNQGNFTAGGSAGMDRSSFYGGGGLIDLSNQLTGVANQQTTDSNTALRSANIADVSRFGGQALASQQALNPQLYQSLARQQALSQQGLSNPYQAQMQALAGNSGYSPVSLINAQGQNINPSANVSAQQLGGPAHIDPWITNPNSVNPGSMTYNNVQGSNVTPGQIGAQNVNAANGNPVLDALNQRALGQQGPSALQAQQNTIASDLLTKGGTLSPSDIRNAQQTSRAGFAARGLDATNASVVDEAMKIEGASRARLLQNLSLAQGVQNQGLAEANQQQNFGTSVNAANFGYGQLGLQGQMANQGAGLTASQTNLGALMDAQQLNQGNALQTQLANQQAGLTAGQTNLGANLQGQLANQQTGLTSQQSNQQAGLTAAQLNGQFGLQYGQANQQANLQAQQFNAQQQQQAALANQQNYLDFQSLNSGTNLAAQQANQQAMMQGQNQQFGQYSNLFGVGNQLQQQQFGYGQQNLANYVGTQFDPYSAILGQNSVNQGTNSNLFGTAAANNAAGNANTGNMFNPWNSYAQDYYNTGYNAQAAAGIANANNQAANKSSQMSMIAGLGGAAIMIF